MSIMTHSCRYFLGTRLRQRHIVRLLRPSAQDTVLDIGCGIGYFFFLLKDSGHSVIGMDSDVPSLKTARLYQNGNFICADIRNLPFKNESFTVLLASEVLEHLPSEDAAVTELYRTLAKNGLLLVTVPCSEGMLSFSPFRLLGHNKEGPEFHYRSGYTKNRLCSLLEMGGFTIEKYAYCTGILAELVVQFSKIGYLYKNKKISCQADFSKPQNSLLYKIYRTLVFPIAYAIGILEDDICNRFLKGHILIVRARKK